MAIPTPIWEPPLIQAPLWPKKKKQGGGGGESGSGRERVLNTCLKGASAHLVTFLFTFSTTHAIVEEHRAFPLTSLFFPQYFINSARAKSPP